VVLLSSTFKYISSMILSCLTIKMVLQYNTPIVVIININCIMFFQSKNDTLIEYVSFYLYIDRIFQNTVLYSCMIHSTKLNHDQNMFPCTFPLKEKCNRPKYITLNSSVPYIMKNTDFFKNKFSVFQSLTKCTK